VIEGKVHDVRFHRYDGPRSGRAAALWSMTRWSALRALGARRGWKAKIIPIALTLTAFFPALVVLGLRALFPSSINDNLESVLPYSDYAGIVGLVFVGSGVALLQAGITALRRLDPLPRNTLTTLTPKAFEQRESL